MNVLELAMAPVQELGARPTDVHAAPNLHNYGLYLQPQYLGCEGGHILPAHVPDEHIHEAGVIDPGDGHIRPMHPTNLHPDVLAYLQPETLAGQSAFHLGVLEPEPKDAVVRVDFVLGQQHGGHPMHRTVVLPVYLQVLGLFSGRVQRCVHGFRVGGEQGVLLSYLVLLIGGMYMGLLV